MQVHRGAWEWEFLQALHGTIIAIITNYLILKNSFIDQPVAYLTNEIHTSANYIHMVISVI